MTDSKVFSKQKWFEGGGGGWLIFVGLLWVWDFGLGFFWFVG